ncbi:MAG: hypothetical protein JSV56_02175 [Methanomassiliicoccales archaeon]|nr:MAG: hypothetical protein JSV56_02175 [Methanomassiliicoccales archaeon]
MYAFEERLQNQHPDNKHVRDKISEQLQMLRDEGIVEFVRIPLKTAPNSHGS